MRQQPLPVCLTVPDTLNNSYCDVLLLLPSADFDALPAGVTLHLEVSTCGSKSATTFDTMLSLQSANPYRHGVQSDTVRV